MVEHQFEDDTGLDQVQTHVDAHSGAVVARHRSLKLSSPVTPTPNAHSQYSGYVTIPVDDENGEYDLWTTTHGRDIYRVNNLNGGVPDYTSESEASSLGTKYPAKSTNHWGNGQNYTVADRAVSDPLTSAHGETAAVDAIFGLMMSRALLRETQGFKQSDAVTTVSVHGGGVGKGSGYFFGRAGYAGGTLFFGDPKPGGFQPTTPEIVAHEYGHGLMDKLLSHTTMHPGEFTAIGEAWGDILGEVVQAYVSRYPAGPWDDIPEGIADWVLGEDIRYFYRPSKDGYSPDYWTEDIEQNGLDPHYGAGPINHMFFFLSQGVMVDDYLSLDGYSSPYLPAGMEGLGINAAFRIVYKAVSAHLVDGDGFLELRAACEQAAIGIHGENSDEHKAVMDAFAAVGVGVASDRQPPSIHLSQRGDRFNATIVATATDPDGVLGGTFIATVHDATGGQYFTGTAYAGNTGELDLGNVDGHFVELKAKATDLLNNEATKTRWFDFEAPVISEQSCFGGTQDQPECSVRVTDGSEVHSIEIYVDGIFDQAVVRRFDPLEPWCFSNCDAAPPTPDDYTFGFYLDLSTVPSGHHDVEVHARDAAGNTAVLSGWSVLVDRKPPTLALQVVGDTGEVRFTAAVHDEHSPDEVDVTMYVDIGFAVCNRVAVDTPSFVRCDYDSSQLPDGDHYLGVRATDRFGNSTFEILEFSTENPDDVPAPQQPVVVWEQEINDTWSQAQKVPLDWTILNGSYNPGHSPPPWHDVDRDWFVVDLPPGAVLHVDAPPFGCHAARIAMDGSPGWEHLDDGESYAIHNHGSAATPIGIEVTLFDGPSNCGPYEIHLLPILPSQSPPTPPTLPWPGGTNGLL